MPVDDYLIDQEGFDWPSLLSDWAQVLPSEFTVWLMNRFGDLFLILPDDTVHMLDIGAGSLVKLAEDREDFARLIDEGDNANLWLMIPLVDRLVASGMHLGPGRCYSHLTPPILGGKYTVENTIVIPIAEHFSLYAYYHAQLRDLPDGTRIRLNVVD